MMSEKVQVRINAGKWTGTLEHTWNYIGYDECNYTHSPGGMELISKFGKLEKPYYMRAHHMLCTGILHAFYKWGSTNVYIEDAQGNPIYNYDLINQIMDIWLGNSASCLVIWQIRGKQRMENFIRLLMASASISEWVGQCRPRTIRNGMT